MKWSVLQKQTICEEILQYGAAVSSILSYLQVKRSRIYKLLDIHHNRKAFCELKGRPSKLDIVARDQITEDLKKAKADMHPLKRKSELIPLLVQRS